MWSGPKGAQAGDSGHREELCLEDSKAFTWGLAPFPSPLAVANLRPAVSVPTTCPGQACHLPSHSSLHSCPCAGVLGSPHSAGMGAEPLEPGHMPNPGGRLGSKMLEIGSGVQSAQSMDPAPRLPRWRPKSPLLSSPFCLQMLPPDGAKPCSSGHPLPHHPGRLRLLEPGVTTPTDRQRDTSHKHSLAPSGLHGGSGQHRLRGSPNCEMAAGPVARIVAIAAMRRATLISTLPLWAQASAKPWSCFQEEGTALGR